MSDPFNVRHLKVREVIVADWSNSGSSFLSISTHSKLKRLVWTLSSHPASCVSPIQATSFDLFQCNEWIPEVPTQAMPFRIMLEKCLAIVIRFLVAKGPFLIALFSCLYMLGLELWWCDSLSSGKEVFLCRS